MIAVLVIAAFLLAGDLWLYVRGAGRGDQEGAK